MANKSKAINSPKKLLAMINAEKHKTKLRIKKIRSKCNHQGKNSLWIRPVKGKEFVCKCQECRAKIDLQPTDTDTETLKREVKTTGKSFINYINILKLMMSPKNDAGELKFLGDVQYGIERAIGILKAGLADEFKPHRKKKKGKKKGKKRGFNFAIGGKSMSFK